MKYKKHNCELKNEAKCEEEMDEDAENVEEEKKKYFDEEEEEDEDTVRCDKKDDVCQV